MDSTRFDGSSELESKASLEDLKRQLEDPEVASVALHKPGSVVERFIKQRVKFRVNEAGEWVVVSPLSIGLPAEGDSETV